VQTAIALYVVVRLSMKFYHEGFKSNYTNWIFVGVFFFCLFRLLELGLDPGCVYNTVTLPVHYFLLWTGYSAGYFSYMLLARSWIAVAVNLLVERWQKKLAKILVVAIYYSIIHFAFVDLIVVMSYVFPDNHALNTAMVRTLFLKDERKERKERKRKKLLTLQSCCFPREPFTSPSFSCWSSSPL